MFQLVLELTNTVHDVYTCRPYMYNSMFSTRTFYLDRDPSQLSC